jgi:hypothetical protein
MYYRCGIDFGQETNYIIISNTLYGSDCNLFKIPAIDYQTIERIELANNNISYVNITAPNLKYLDLSNNIITKIKLNCPKLKKLLLNNNQIEEMIIPDSLDELNIKNNFITSAELI